MRQRLPVLVAAVLLAVAVFAPLLANDAPLVARVGGALRWPAFAEWCGSRSTTSDVLDWPAWERALPAGSADFAWSTPWPHGPLTTDPLHAREGPSLAHPCGRDDTGRDVLARLLHGVRTGIGLGALGVLLAACIGVLLGGLAGLRGGLVDALVLRLIELFVCFPLLLVLLALSGLFGGTSIGIVVVFAMSMWPSFARVVRGELLSLRERAFVETAQGLGVSEGRILTRHLLPHLRGPIGTTAAFCMAQAVIAESTLSYLGFGPGAPSGSWGGILQQGQANAHLGVWHLWLFPALAIVLTVLCCHALAERWRPAR